MKKTLFFWATFANAILLANAAYACSCVVIPTEQHLKNSDVAFVGKFKRLTSDINGGVSVAVFDVGEVLKGRIIGGEVLISSGPICKIEWRSEPGTIWTVYAGVSETNSVPPKPIFQTSLCSGTAQQ